MEEELMALTPLEASARLHTETIESPLRASWRYNGGTGRKSHQ